ncbi:MAG: ATP-binding protein [Thaumarchaeota archaeon]|nr:ATP-binding protein [Nitrososphaerota archaeon]
MNIDITKLSEIKLGMIAQIIDLDDELVEGEIIHIISKYDNPNGIMVKIKEGPKGNVQKILKVTVEHSDKNLSDEMILLPESWKLEYKKSFKPNFFDVDKQWINSFNVFKAIAGFANAEGGRLVIGVEDVKNEPLRITGLSNDFEYIQKYCNPKSYEKYANDQDGMELRLMDEFDHYFSQQPLTSNLVRISFVGKKPEKMICIVDVKRSVESVIMYASDAPQSKQGPNFFVRVNNQTKPYKPADFIRYWVQHVNQMMGRDRLPIP